MWLHYNRSVVEKESVCMEVENDSYFFMMMYLRALPSVWSSWFMTKVRQVLSSESSRGTCVTGRENWSHLAHHS